MLGFIDEKGWLFEYHDFTLDSEMHREALLTQGNGYFGTRGAFCENKISDSFYPGTYMAGFYNRLTSKVADKDVVNEDFVNCPDWTYISFSTDGHKFVDMSSVKILSIRRQLNLKTALLRVIKKIEDSDGHIFTIISERFVSMATMHLAGISYSVTSENYSGKLFLRSSLNGNIHNWGVERYRQLESKHLIDHQASYENNILALSAQSSESNIKVVQMAKHNFFLDNQAIDSNSTLFTDDHGDAVLDTQFDIKISQTIKIEKSVVMANSLFPKSEPELVAGEQLSLSKSFADDFKESASAWERVWEKTDISLSGDADITQVLRFHSYHLIVAASSFNSSLDAAVPARGLHGEAYRGHIFWDEMYILPFYLWHFPETAKSLLMYRVNRLDSARKYAAEFGYKGAMFPWQGGSDGSEETQTLHLNPASGEWGDDYSCLQRHVSLAVFYNIWTYFLNTGDLAFLTDHGAEVLLEIVRFWAGMTTFNKKTSKYEISGVMGPNEFHEKMPNSDKGGLKDNGYTNIFTAWALECSLKLKDLLPNDKYNLLIKKIDLGDEELTQWEKIRCNINIPSKDGVLAQYDGFLELKELDWDSYRKKYDHIGRMDRILKAEGLSPDDFQLGKQADLLMLFYIFPWSVVSSLLKNNGIDFSKDDLEKNYEYYLKRTSHGSTLSLIVHAYLAMQIGNRPAALDWYKRSLSADIEDFHGGTTKEGIHTGLMAGTLVLMIKGFAGLETFNDFVSFEPNIPEEWGDLKFSFSYKGSFYKVSVSQSIIEISGSSEADEIKINNKLYHFSDDKKLSIKL